MPSQSKTHRKNTILFGLALRERGPSGRWRIRIRWGAFVGVVAGLALLTYLLFASLLYFLYFPYIQGYKEVKFTDMLTLVVNRAEHRVKVGDFQIEQAKEALKEGKYREALQYLQTGVIRSPKNLEGRMLLADFFIQALDQPERGQKILAEGIPYAADNVDYVRSYLRSLLAYQKDNEVIEVANSLLPETDSEEVRRVLAIGAASSSYYRGRYDQAEAYLEEYGLDQDDLEAALLMARINWDRGAQEQALAHLEDAIGRFDSRDAIYELLARYNRELGNTAKARRYTVLRNVNSPLSIGPRIDLLQTLDATGQQDRSGAEVQSLLNQFSNNENAMLMLGNYATEKGDTELIGQIYQIALENEFNIASFSLLMIECHIVAQDYRGAIEFMADLLAERPDWIDNHWAIFNSLRAVAYYGLGNQEMSDLYLDQFLKTELVRINSLLAVARRFQEMGGKSQARQILLRAYQLNPDNQAALTGLIELEIDLGNSAEMGPYLEALLEMRRPSKETLERAYSNLGSDRFIFTQDRYKLLESLDQIINRGEQPPPGTQAATKTAAESG